MIEPRREAVFEVVCACGADLYLSGDWEIVSEQGMRFYALHRNDGHRVHPVVFPHDHRGRDNGTCWWEPEADPDARSLVEQPDAGKNSRFKSDPSGVSMG